MVLYEYTYNSVVKKIFVKKFEAKETQKAYFINDNKAQCSRVLKSEISKLQTSNYLRVMYLLKPDFTHYKNALIEEKVHEIELRESRLQDSKKALEDIKNLKEGNKNE